MDFPNPNQSIPSFTKTYNVLHYTDCNINGFVESTWMVIPFSFLNFDVFPPLQDCKTLWWLNSWLVWWPSSGMIAPRISSTLPAWFSAQPMILKARLARSVVLHKDVWCGSVLGRAALWQMFKMVATTAQHHAKMLTAESSQPPQPASSPRQRRSLTTHA